MSRTKTIDLHAMQHLRMANCSMHIETDMITDIKEVTVFTDDGHGNGVMLFRVRYGDLLRICADYNTIIDQIES